MAFFKVRRPRQFSYTPRYYDERKERIAAIEEAIRLEREGHESADPALREARLRLAFEQARLKHKKARPARQGMRTTAILALLIGILYFYFHL